MDRIADPGRAQRLARAILSDVMLYNPDKVRAGIEADDLFERLRAELEEARAFFDERVDSEVAERTNAFDLALVDVLVFRSRAVRSKIW
jgi:predicted NBD/HSP70 family sugar kinase